MPAIASTTTRIATRPKVLSRRSRLRGGCSSVLDEGVDTEDEIADEMGHEDEQQPPAPPEEVRRRFHLTQLDHGQIERKGQGEEHHDGREAEQQENQHTPILRERVPSRKCPPWRPATTRGTASS